jgi:TorA maturation chaperone TorD
VESHRLVVGRAVDAVIKSFGGLSRLAEALGHTHVTTVQGWRDRGAIPLKHHARILDAAKTLGIRLHRHDLLDELPLANVADEDAARAQCYTLLAHLLHAPPSPALLDVVRSLKADGSELGEALGALASVAQQTTPEAAEREYSALFIGISRGELLPYASYYLTGFLQEKPLADLRGEMARLGIVRRADVPEPEDHIASLCEMMAGLITGAFDEPAALAEQQKFFARHLAPWAPRFFEDLQAAKSAVLYMPVGRIGRLFMTIEAEAFGMAE